MFASRVVHVIKSFNSLLQALVPETLQGIRHQVAGSLRTIHNLASKEDQAVGGFQMKVNGAAKGLGDAHRLVDDIGFLNSSCWLKAGDENVAYRGLTAQLVTKERLFANANWVYNQTVQSKMFVGAAANRPPKEQVQAIVDILNALGWNAGIRRPTKSLDPNAWWHLTPSTDGAIIAAAH